jgi:nucleoside-diphosphate-sugar epimerase
LSGIYSPERNIFLRLARKQVRYVKKSNHIFSRIHIADIAQVLSKSLIYSKPGEIYNVSDNLPCPYDQTISYACNLMGVKIPPSENFKSSNDSKMKNFYKDSKKVSNLKIKKDLKVKLQFPSYKEGFKSILNNIFNY